MTPRFEQSKDVESRWEDVLDQALRESGYQVEKAGERDRRRGIDRHVSGVEGVLWWVQYRIDTQAARTGRILIGDGLDVGPWGHGRLDADIVLCFATPNTVLAFDVRELRRVVFDWQWEALASPDPEPAHISEGDGCYLPIAEAETIALYTAHLGRGDGLYMPENEDESD